MEAQGEEGAREGAALTHAGLEGEARVRLGGDQEQGGRFVVEVLVSRVMGCLPQNFLTTFARYLWEILGKAASMSKRTIAGAEVPLAAKM